MINIPSENLIAYIKDNILISDVVKEKVKLIKNGSVFKGLCPFHHEKTPSFLVNDSRKTYHCFGCGAHGDIFSFVEKNTGQGFRDALDYFSKQLGITVENNYNNVQKNDFHEEFEILEWTARFFEKKLENNLEAQQYLQKRFISSEMIKKFRIGFAPRGNQLIKFLLKKKYNLKKLLDLGIAAQYNDEYYSYFYDRIIFPIIDKKNQVRGFGGRIFNMQKSAKYLNSKESPVFQKNQLFFGENLLPSKCSAIFIVEGYLDVIAMNEKDLHTIAPMGTTFNNYQLQKIIKLTNKIYIFFDSDDSGKNATKKMIIETILPNLTPHINISIIKNHSGKKDPHEIIHSSENLNEIINNATPLSQYIWNILINGKNFNSPEEITQLEENIDELINKIPHPILKKNYKYFLQNKIYKIKKTAGYTKKSLVNTHIHSNIPKAFYKK